MLVEKNFLNLLYLGSRQKRDKRSYTHSAIYQRALHADYNQKRTVRKTRDMIAMLLAHGTRATRASQPKTQVLMNVFTPDGTRAVKIKMAK